MTFDYRFFTWTCTCGESTENVRVGFTSHFRVMGVWVCERCEKKMAALITLQKALEGIPNHPEQDEEGVSKIEEDKPKQDDNDFLSGMGIDPGGE